MGNTKERNSGYLPVLPKGWRYHVALDGPGGNRVTVNSTDNGGFDVVTNTTEVTRRTHESSLADALRAASKGAKALDEVAKREAEFHKARDSALAALGEAEGGGDPLRIYRGTGEAVVEAGASDAVVPSKPGG